MSETQLPVISNSCPATEQKQQSGCERAESVQLPGVAFGAIRNPILGTMIQYTTYLPPRTTSRFSNRMQLAGSHTGGMFEDTSYRSSYYDIHPDWTSEVNSARRLSSRNRPHYSWDNRPAFNPLTDYVIPVLERRRSCDIKVNQAIHTARASAQQRRHLSRGNTPITEGITSRSLPAVNLSPNSSRFYKTMLANEILSPRRGNSAIRY